MSQLLVCDLPDYELAILHNQGHVVGVAFDEKKHPSVVGAVREGRVLGRRPNTNTFYVDIKGITPKTKPAFLQAPKGSDFNDGEKIWVKITRDAFANKGPKIILAETEEPQEPVSPVQEFIEYYLDGTSDAIIQRSKKSAGHKKMLEDAGVGVKIAAKLATMQNAFDVEELLETLESPVYELEEGGSLTIQSLEAVTFVDVDSGNSAETNLNLNLKMANVIADQMRWRNLAGTIVVDFLNVPDKHQKQIIKTLQTALEADRLPTKILGFTKAGLFELVRPRKYRPFA